jgi:hypothetical protein
MVCTLLTGYIVYNKEGRQNEMLLRKPLAVEVFVRWIVGGRVQVRAV